MGRLLVIPKADFTANSLGTVSVLPDIYTELDYIQTDGNQYILSDYYPGPNTKVVMDIELSALNGSGNPNGCIFTSRRDEESDARIQLNFGNASYYYRIYAWTKLNSSKYIGTTTTSILGHKTLTLDVPGKVASWGTTSVSLDATDFTTAAHTLMFFRSQSGTTMSTYSVKIYSIKIYELDELVRNLIPVKTSTSNGLYDWVTGAFWHSASGYDFVEPTV